MVNGSYVYGEGSQAKVMVEREWLDVGSRARSMAGRFVDAAVVTCAGARDGSYETLRSARGQLPGKCVGIVSSSSLLPIASFSRCELTCLTLVALMICQETLILYYYIVIRALPLASVAEEWMKVFIIVTTHAHAHAGCVCPCMHHSHSR